MTRLQWILPLALIGLCGCVNISLPSDGGKRSQGVKFTAPGNPFRDLASPGADHAWLSEKTGNTISYISDCESRLDPTLAQMQSETLNVLTKLKVEDEKSIPYNGRLAQVATASGEVDGIAVKMKVLSLKKNSCNYSLTYTAVRAHFDSEAGSFQNFIDGFQAQ